MSIKALKDFTYVSRYARYNKEKKRRDTWEESCDKLEEMHSRKYPELASEIKEIIGYVRQKKLLGSQRSLQFAGDPIFAHMARLYNCSFSYCDRLRFFQETLYLLLCGSGVGFSVQLHHIAKLPKFSNSVARPQKTFQIPDSIEGWSDALGILLSSYFEDAVFPEYANTEVVFDYSLIRPKGSSFSHGVGKAPGPDGLRNSLEKIKELLDLCKRSGQEGLKPINAYDIVMHASDAVLSGGVRRSATLCMFSLDDEEMMNAKTGDWFYTNPQRGRSNNSVVLHRKYTSKEKFLEIFDKVKQFGEPGFIWVDDYEVGHNPCVIGSTIIPTKEYGYVRISDVINKEVTTWNGYEWSVVIPKVTGYNQDTLIVHLSNGKSLQCTNYHNWIVDYDGNPYKVEAQDLKIGQKIYHHNEPIQPEIIKIEDGGVVGKVYCFNEPLKNLGCFNGIITGQCVEIALYAYNDKGESGFEFCNLVEINGKKVKTKEDFANIVVAAAKLGTLQAGYNQFPYLGKITEEIVQREALLGVSVTGIMDSPEILLDPKIQKEMAELIIKTNKEMAKKIGINPAARTTCVKPAGSTSCILGTSSGIHPHHAKRYFRRVQENKLSEPLKFFGAINPKAVEESVWSADKTDDVLTFCVEVPEGSRVKNDMTALDMLKTVKLTQNNWVEYGTNHEACVKPWLRHNVSNTINVSPSEWDGVADYIFEHKDSFAGISLIPNSGDKDYQQAPFCAVFTPSEIVKMYGDASIFASGIIEAALWHFRGNLWLACDTVLGLNKTELTDQLYWVEKAKSFADRYFNGDIRRMTYCLKDVHNWKLWVDLKREWKDVDYTQMIEEEDNTKLSETIACAGGACEIKF